MAIARLVELGLDLYAGDDNLIFPFLRIGSTGGICVHTHVVGPLVRRMVDAFRSGDEEAARRIDWLVRDYKMEPWAAHMLIGYQGQYDVVTVAGSIGTKAICGSRALRRDRRRCTGFSSSRAACSTP